MTTDSWATALDEHFQVFKQLSALEPRVRQAADLVSEALNNGGRVLVCGNGGSAADAQHFAAELTGRFERERPGLAAIALTTDTSALTAIGNDYGFEKIFARQLQALGRPGDVLLGISTSGHSANVFEAVHEGRSRGLTTLGLLGRDGGSLAAAVDMSLVVPANRTARIQEAHLFILHMLCTFIEDAL